MYKIKTSELLSGKSIVKELINIDVVKNISDDLFETKHHYLMVAYSLEYKIEFSFDIEDVIYETKGTECRGCSNNCEIIEVLRDKRVIDAWGNRCPKGELVHK